MKILERPDLLARIESRFRSNPVTRSLNVARDDLKLKRAFVVHPGRKSYPLNDWAEAVAIGDLRSRVEKLV